MNIRTDDRQIDRTGRKGKPTFSCCWGHEMSRKHERLPDRLDYNTFLTYAREVKIDFANFYVVSLPTVDSPVIFP